MAVPTRPIRQVILPDWDFAVAAIIDQPEANRMPDLPKMVGIRVSYIFKRLQGDFQR
ncbi:MAG: hypothetical protein PHS52_02520 [Desulfotomaculaceae bacterium]|nr:hypothetical protein [Desulfotomaculaceae bacterium]